MRIEVITLIGWILFFAVGFLCGCYHGEHKALSESHDKNQRDAVAEAWIETLKDLGGKKDD